MKKIMFNDRYGLTKAVLDGTKTMTRRVIPEVLNVEDPDISEWGLTGGGKAMITLYEGGRPTTDIFPMYQPGEVVAVAQSYQTILDTVFGDDQQWKYGYMRDVEESHEKMWEDIKGRTNKMFVKADLMPHQIRITDIKVERLQDISVRDCYEEGIVYAKWRQWPKPDSREYIDHDVYTLGIYKEGILDPWAPDDPDAWIAKDPQTAFHVLIRKMMGVKKWESNPYVFAYSFKLIK